VVAVLERVGRATLAVAKEGGADLLRKKAALICADSSLSLKYRWPEAGRAMFEISPSTQSRPTPCSSRVFTWRFSWLTVIAVA
jgi:hypothetical protein